MPTPNTLYRRELNHCGYGDEALVAAEVDSGDGSSTAFTVTKLPVSRIVTVEHPVATILYEPEGYVFNHETGVCTFATAPANGTDNIEFNYWAATATTSPVGKVISWVPNRDKMEKIHARHVGDGTRNVASHFPMKKTAGGVLTTKPQNGEFWVYALGSCADSTDGTYKTHTITETTTHLPCFTFEGSIDLGTDFTRKYAGCFINSVTMSQNRNEHCKEKWDIWARYLAKQTSKSSISQVTTEPCRYNDTRITIDGVHTYENLSYSLTLSNNLDSGDFIDYDDTLGSKEFYPQDRDYKLTFSRYGFTTTEWDDLVSATPNTGITITLMQQRAVGDYRKFTLSGCSVDDDPMPFEDKSIMEDSITFVPKSSGLVVYDATATYPAGV